jgi:hypothetical protein
MTYTNCRYFEKKINDKCYHVGFLKPGSRSGFDYSKPHGGGANIKEARETFNQRIKEHDLKIEPVVPLSEVLELLDLEGMGYDNEGIEMALINFKNKLKKKYGVSK